MKSLHEHGLGCGIFKNKLMINAALPTWAALWKIIMWTCFSTLDFQEVRQMVSHTFYVIFSIVIAIVLSVIWTHFAKNKNTYFLIKKYKEMTTGTHHKFSLILWEKNALYLATFFWYDKVKLWSSYTNFKMKWSDNLKNNHQCSALILNKYSTPS